MHIFFHLNLIWPLNSSKDMHWYMGNGPDWYRTYDVRNPICLDLSTNLGLTGLRWASLPDALVVVHHCDSHTERLVSLIVHLPVDPDGPSAWGTTADAEQPSCSCKWWATSHSPGHMHKVTTQNHTNFVGWRMLWSGSTEYSQEGYLYLQNAETGFVEVVSSQAV